MLMASLGETVESLDLRENKNLKQHELTTKTQSLRAKVDKISRESQLLKGNTIEKTA